ncbi:serine hydrolase [Rhodocaloribacter litoris]|uniref:serine hydrolase n=1 Tax=Rhodocaloribacter litoris TaxID=2558931 RepID=UPI00141E7D50|nr:serine hydrolase [Rhodocaloribacter litoris]QXD14195.1 serine hydrolase [Rhodocaloribacter litoris]
MRRLLFFLLATGLLASRAPGQSPTERLELLFTQDTTRAEWFAPPFLEQVPAEQVARIVRQLRQDYGEWVGATGRGIEYDVSLERANIPTRIVLDARGRIAGLFFGPPVPLIASREALLDSLRQLPGTVSLFVQQEGRDAMALQPDTALAVGSAFKLAVLLALRRALEAGRHRWDEVVRLRPEWKSLPSGFLHTWPEASPLTLHTLAALMISQSDNTATDALIHLLGRAPIEALAPRNRPFLTTREAFVLKNPANHARAQHFLEAGLAERTSLLPGLQALPLPDESLFADGPVRPEVEWFFSARELCTLISAVYDLPVMQINPGLARREDWQLVAFKGGSEPGVLNLTTYLVDHQNRHHCISATWNHTDVLDQARFAGLYRRLLQQLRTQP